MKKRRMIPLLLVIAAGVLGFGLTGEKAQEVQKRNAPAETENIGCRAQAMNPLREEAYPELSETVRTYYGGLGDEKDFVESYDNIRVYTKLGRYTGTYVAFVKYEMKIKDIYTKVPGLGVLYMKKNGTGSGYYITGSSADEGLKEYMMLITSHRDVQDLLQGTNEEYEAAVQSDALLAEALADLKNAYEEGNAGRAEG